ncbi:hypothetical protein CGRA01v4_12066 [Colletotrichum graminicola]|nr:hypothetical protein CGRA01v4_12066 [Colletotrichum graminicola]
MTTPRNTKTGGESPRLCTEPDAASRCCMSCSEAEEGLQSQSGLGLNLSPTAGVGDCLFDNQDWTWSLMLLYVSPLIGKSVRRRR